MLAAVEQINYLTVLLFGVVLSVAFSGVDHNKKNRIAVLLLFLLLTLIQAFFYHTWGLERTKELYPLITHLPLIMGLAVYFKKPWVLSAVSVLSAYLCCQARRCFGTITLLLFHDMTVNYAVQIAMTLPLLIILIRYVAPQMQRLMCNPRRSVLFFAVVPTAYYLFDYITTVYTDILHNEIFVTVEFMPSVMAVCYYLFVVIHTNEMQNRHELEKERQILSVLANQGLMELESLRRSQLQAALYHHDLRHHLQFVDACLQNGKLEEARAYIEEASSEIERNSIIRYCENETVNLILSSYATKAKKANIKLICKADLAPDIGVHATDLCVILANGLENALRACEQVNGERFVSLVAHRQMSRVFLQIQNSYNGQILFANGLPVRPEIEQGFGVKSMVMTIEKLGGLCDFFAENGVFTMRASM